MGTANGTEAGTELSPRASLGVLGDGPDGCRAVGVGVRGVAGACCSLRVFLLCQEIYGLFHGVCALMIYCMWGKCCIPAVLCCVLALLVGAGWGWQHHLILTRGDDTWLPHLHILGFLHPTR